MSSSLKSLVDIISQNVATLEAALEARGVAAPSLDAPFTPDSDITNGQQQLRITAELVSRAALQLVQLVRSPQITLLQASGMHIMSASMRCAIELHIVEILSEAGPEGLHVDIIAEKCGVQAEKLGGILRCLAGSWIFKEVTPDVFANNRLSSLLNKGQSVAELKKSPEDTYVKPQAALSALAAHISDESLKSSGYLLESLTDPVRGFSGDAKDSSFSLAIKNDITFWDYIRQPDQTLRLKRFGAAMEGTRAMEPPGLPIAGYKWGDLPEDAVVVDVGGGIGTVSAQISAAFPKLRFVVQDFPDVVKDGEARFKDLVASGRLTFEAHDFFKPNPVKKPDVFLIRYIVHDWSDDSARKILRQLRDAAGPKTVLVGIDRIVPYSCNIVEGVKVPGLIQQQLPAPLTMAYESNPSFKASALMTSLCNGRERTMKHAVDLYASAGWKIENVVQFEGGGALPSNIWATPI